MRSLLQDLRYGMRVLRRAPGFTAAAIATLALGIGVNTAIFSMVNVQMLKPLSYRQPERVAFVLAWNAERQERRFSLSYADFLDLQQSAQSFEDVAAYRYWSANLTGGDMPERIQAYRVTANTFAMLGVAPVLGRGPLPEEGRPGGREVVVIGHGLWQRRFGGDPSAVGRVVQLDGRPYTIVGVMPRSFEYPVFNFKGDLWAPLQVEPSSMLADRGSAGTPRSWRVSARASRTRKPRPTSTPSCAGSPPSIPRRTARSARSWSRWPRWTTSWRGRRRSSLSSRSRSCCCSPVRTSPTSCWPAACRGSGSSRCARPSGPAARGLRGSFSWRACCWASAAARRAWLSRSSRWMRCAGRCRKS